MENVTQQIEKILEEYEKDLSWKQSGELSDRFSHTLRQYKSIADNAIWEAKRFLEDVKTQFKAIELIVEGISGDGLNHGQTTILKSPQ